MNDADIMEETSSSFFENPFGWFMKKCSQLIQKREEEMDEWAEHQANQKIETYLNAHPELAAKAISSADIGLAKGILSPAVYEMLQDVETTHNHTPAPDPSISVDSPNKAKSLEISR